MPRFFHHPQIYELILSFVDPPEADPNHASNQVGGNKKTSSFDEVSVDPLGLEPRLF